MLVVCFELCCPVDVCIVTCCTLAVDSYKDICEGLVERLAVITQLLLQDLLL